ncbi:uncharacterized protein BX664DRAFT_291945 [Halteromyces radiatus]|uniref:uncharacterized protein n=1 Tax=Halteromyces radiatus TaxID=101107 RepID=UPI002220B282|nr:uncharacterized protein BX664DRAFT_291945 [Halteromyces radiatus]KAI8096805.1 hypothetical protein BX664DRAFT_291945 [Halteromyces radiatus]
MQIFDTSTRSWCSFPNCSSTTNTSSSSSLLSEGANDIPASSQHHSAFLLNDHQHILLYGGQNSTHALGQFYSYDITAQQWTLLSLPSTMNVMRCGHSANLLENGLLLILGGFICEKGQVLNDNGNPRILANMSMALVYNTVTTQWTEKSTFGDYPKPRAYHTAVQSQDGVPPPYQTYLSSQGQLQDMMAILNTTNWQWSSVQGSSSTMDQPLPQSMASGLMIDDHTLMYGFGTSYQTVSRGIYLFDINTRSWVSSGEQWADLMDDNNHDSVNLPSTRMEFHIIIGCISIVCLITVLILLYRMGRQWKQKSLDLLYACKKKIWKPRIGEPSWTETIRLSLLFVYVCFFLFLIFSLVEQVVNSPIIDQVSYVENPTSTVSAPDIRFCLDDEHTVIRCGTDIGMQCSNYIISITSSMPRRGRKQYCYLFRASPSFRLGQASDRLASNGSYLKFDYYFGQPSQVEVSFYNSYHNPNLAVYSIQDPFAETTPPFSWNSPSEEIAFRSSDNKGYLSNNIYHLDVNVVSTGSYELLQRVSLRDSFWNYVGFAPSVDAFYEIDSKVQAETTQSDYSSLPRPLGSFHVYPMRYEIKTLHEQRAFAMLNATGVFGGLFGLFVSLQACLFGYRPRSPLGLIHRWSIGDMKRSLLYGLKQSFVPQTSNIPIVHPMRDQTLNSVHNSKPLTTMMENPTSTTSGERLTRIEDRMEVLEKVFQAYYINDEIFTALEMAIQVELSPFQSQTHQQQEQQQQRHRMTLPSSLRSRIPFRRRS